MRLTLPLPLNRANARLHWRAESRKKLAYMAECDQRQLAGLIEAPTVTWQEVSGTAVLFLHQEMDDDNLEARMKWPRDWLETRGYIVDDKDLHLIVSQQIDRKRQRVELDITPVREHA